ncbi:MULTISPECIES: hypothetical protein [Streptomyces]|uniref:Spore-associated protein A n=1 Tax=Streptomyces solicathayae TaxID=3081768 RepID=A0ABZ0M1N0_9ACTN|nr:hypothetical protein [Streptomyces sp. HUAS YS2]WOX25502.1 hypothetical protein R2D22_30660 [Streptomyces sp. HUAS YS2]
MRKITKALFTVGTAIGLTLGMATAASAASNPVSVCGSGYYVQESHNLGWYLPTDEPQAKVYLLYNSSTGYNCVVTVVTGGQVSNPINAGLRVEGGSWVTDPGQYNSYAGPIRLKANGKCVQYMGSTRYWTGSGVPYTDTYTSPLGHCG